MQKIITILISFFSLFLFSQEKLKVEYEMLITQTKMNLNGYQVPDNIKEELQQRINQRNRKPRTFTLYYSAGNTYFSGEKLKKSFIKNQSVYFKQKNKEGYYRFYDFIEKQFYGYYPNDNLIIEYTDKTKKIENYTCKLALLETNNGTAKVWYTEQFPISAGPFAFCHFPGLVLKVETASFVIYATSITNQFKDEQVKILDESVEIYQGEVLKKKIKEQNHIMKGKIRERLQNFYQ